MSEYIDGELSEETASEVRVHIAACGGCQETYESLTRIIGYMNDMDRVEEPVTLLGDVKTRLEKGPSFYDMLYRFFSPPVVRTSMGLAGVALVAVLIAHMAGIGGGPDLIETDLTETDVRTFGQQRVPAAGDEAALLLNKLEVSPVENEKAKPSTGEDRVAVRGGRSGEVEINLDRALDAPASAPAPAPDKEIQEITSSETATPEEKREDKGGQKKGPPKTKILHLADEALSEKPAVITSSDALSTDYAEIKLSVRDLEWTGEPVVESGDLEVSASTSKSREQATEKDESQPRVVSALSPKRQSKGDHPLVKTILSVGGKVTDLTYEDQKNAGRLTGFTVELPPDSLGTLVNCLRGWGEVTGAIQSQDYAKAREGLLKVKIILSYPR
jgi:hypothetical protein